MVVLDVTECRNLDWLLLAEASHVEVCALHAHHLMVVLVCQTCTCVFSILLSV